MHATQQIYHDRFETNEANELLIPKDIYPDWERFTTQEGFPYYVNLKTGESQWINPHLMEIISKTKKFDNVIYSAWRMGEKIDLLSKELSLSSLKYSEFIDLFDINPADNEIEINQVIQVLNRVYEHLDDTNEDMEDFVDIVLNCAILMSDSKYKIDADAFNLLIIVFCVRNIHIMHKSIFHLFTKNHGDVMKVSDFDRLMHYLWKIAELVGETDSLSKSNNLLIENKEKTYQEYYAWAKKGNSVVTWLESLCHLSHNIVHSVACSLCDRSPIHGVKFKCLHCHNYNMCRQCCLQGKTSAKHLITHQITFHSKQISTKVKLKEYYKRVKNTLSKDKSKKSMMMTNAKDIGFNSYKLRESALLLMRSEEMIENEPVVSAGNMIIEHNRTFMDNDVLLNMSKENSKLEDQIKSLKILLFQSNNDLFEETKHESNLLMLADQLGSSLCRLIHSLS